MPKLTERELCEKIRSFAQLRAGWCNGDEIPPDEKTISTACEWVKKACWFGLDVDVFPGDDNSILVVPVNEKGSLEIEVSGSTVICMEEQNGAGPKYEVVSRKIKPSDREVDEFLKKFSLDSDKHILHQSSHSDKGRYQSWYSSEFLTQGNMIVGKTYTENQSLPWATASRYFPKTAPRKRVEQYAPTYKTTTTRCMEVPRLLALCG